MKVHIDLPWGGHLRYERKPLEDGKFYALAVLAAGALFVVLLLGSVALR